jgi:DNA polymerase-4
MRSDTVASGHRDGGLVAEGVAEPILHVDMDAFFASVEQRDEPSLRGRPVAVGGGGDRAVVAAASYEARRFGVRSAMPMVRARRLCPDLVVMPPRFDAYREVSEAVFSLFRDFTPLVQPLSIDEAFLDVSGAVKLFGDPVTIGHAIRARVREVVNLPCSVGIGPTLSVAKLLSGKAKPDGLKILRIDEVEAALRPLPVSDLWGAGPKTCEKLTDYGFTTVGQIADADPRTLRRVVGTAVADHLQQLALGRDVRKVTTSEPTKSVSASATFEEDVDDPDVLHRRLMKLAETVGRRMRTAGHAGRTVHLTVRFASFDTITRSTTMPLPTDSTRDITDLALAMLDGLRLERIRIRLLGVGVSNIVEGSTARQMALDTDPRWASVESTADAVADRFPDLRLQPASLLEDDHESVMSPIAEDTARIRGQ